ncbi:MAG: hypothetical protein KAG97_09450 [Victivallales bacterium]|nr:hypothetical protein [Victivallales bacterium]
MGGQADNFKAFEPRRKIRNAVFSPSGENAYSNSCARRFAFTLLEVLLALMILMLVLMVVGTGLSVMRRSWVKCRENSERLKRILLVDKLVDSTFRNIIPFKWRDEQKKSREIFLGEPNKVVFATTHAVNSVAEGAIRFVMLRLDTGKLRVSYSNTPILYWDSKAAPRFTEVVTENVEKLELRYADFDSDKRLIWDSDWDEKTRRNIPVAVLIRLTWKNGETIQWIKRTAGAGRDESYGRRIDERR